MLCKQGWYRQSMSRMERTSNITQPGEVKVLRRGMPLFVKKGIFNISEKLKLPEKHKPEVHKHYQGN
jgi:hypothetical protein